MRLDLALRHQLLLEAQKLSAEAGAPPARRAALRDLARSLDVRHDRPSRTFRLQAQVNQRRVEVDVPDSTWRFYSQGTQGTLDTPPGPSTVASGIASDNAAHSREQVLALLAQAGVETGAGRGDRAGAHSPRIDRWPWAVALIIASTSAAMVLSLGGRMFNLIDQTYTLEIAWRILQGEVPYRDFVLVLPPGTFLVQAALMWLFGPLAALGLYWAALVQFLTILLTHHLLRALGVERWLAALLCLIPATIGHLSVPHVWYDMDAILVCLVSMAVLLAAERRAWKPAWSFGAGLLAVGPVLFKQNLGLAHVALVVLVTAAAWMLHRRAVGLRTVVAFVAGLAAAGLLIFLALWMVDAVASARVQTLELAVGLRRKSVAAILGAVGRLHARPINFAFAAPIWLAMALGLTSWVAGVHRSRVRLLFPFWIAGLALAAFASQGLMSATPLGSLVALTLGSVSSTLDPLVRWRTAQRVLVVSTTLLVAVSFGVYSLSGQRLHFFVGAWSDPQPFGGPRFEGLRVSGEQARAIDALIEFANRLPVDARIGLLPTEDPLYFATGRRSPLRLVQSYGETGGDPVHYLAELERAQPEWILVKPPAQQQFRYWNRPAAEEVSWLAERYRLSTHAGPYEVWARVPSPP